MTTQPRPHLLRFLALGAGREERARRVQKACFCRAKGGTILQAARASSVRRLLAKGANQTGARCSRE